jgi:MFS family permease
VAFNRHVWPLLLNGVLLGVAYSMVAVATVHLMTVALFHSDERNHSLNVAALNLGFVAVGLGALAGPWAIRLAHWWWGFRQGLLTVSVVLLAPAAFTVFCDSALFPRTTENGPNWHDVITHPEVPLIALVIVLYFALENLLEYWPEAFLKEIRYRDRALDLGLLLFWLAFIATRGAAAWWLFHHPTHGLALTIILLIASACIVGNLASGFDVGNSTVGFLLAGACYGPILPGLLGCALDLYGGHLPLSALGALLALSGLDTLLLRPIMDTFTRGRPARSVMRVPTFLAFALVAPLLLLAFLRN